MCRGKEREGDGIKEPYHWPGTRAFVALQVGVCLSCSKEGTCLWVDKSDYEYHAITLCFECIKTFFTNLSLPDISLPEAKQCS